MDVVLLEGLEVNGSANRADLLDLLDQLAEQDEPARRRAIPPPVGADETPIVDDHDRLVVLPSDSADCLAMNRADGRHVDLPKQDVIAIGDENERTIPRRIVPSPREVQSVSLPSDGIGPVRLPTGL